LDPKKYLEGNAVQWNPELEKLYWNPKEIKQSSLFEYIAKIIIASPQDLSSPTLNSQKSKKRDEPLLVAIVYLIFSNYFSQEWILNSLKSLSLFSNMEINNESSTYGREELQKKLEGFLKGAFSLSKSLEFSRGIKDVEKSLISMGVLDFIDKKINQ
jgi:hypothetical protein